MKILFVHQNMPGQYRELLQWLIAHQNHQIAFLTQRKAPPKFEGVRTIIYKPHHVPGQKAYGVSKVWEQATGAGFGAAMAARALEKDHDFKPDIVVGHVGWGELTFFKQVWPDVPIIGFFEYYYRLDGGIVGFDPSEPVNDHTPFLLEARNAVRNGRSGSLPDLLAARPVSDEFSRPHVCVPRWHPHGQTRP